MIRLRALLLPPLILLLVVTGTGLGMARGAMAADRQLCSVTGPAPVVLAHDGLPLFDAEGEPVTLDRGACLACLIAAFDLPPAAVDLSAPCALSAATVLPPRSDWMPAGASPGGLARAPPTPA
jgi:hypothetical protein